MTRHGATVLVADQDGTPLISIGEPMTTLDEAWAAAVAALPVGGKVTLWWHPGRVTAMASGPNYKVDDLHWGCDEWRATGTTPTAALQNLARSLLENPGGTE